VGEGIVAGGLVVATETTSPLAGGGTTSTLPLRSPLSRAGPG
jgi:hypothetical protein